MATVYYNSAASGANDGTSEADAYTDLQTALNSLSAGDHLYVKRAASREGAITTNLTFNTTSAIAGGDPTIIEGYETTPGDGGMYQTSSPFVIGSEHVILMFFDIDKQGDGTNAFTLRGDCSIAYRCKATSTYAFGNCFAVTDAAAIECAAYGQASSAGDGAFELNRGALIGCYAECTGGANGAAIDVNMGYRNNTVIGCVCTNTGSGANNNGIYLRGSNNSAGCQIVNNTVYNFNNGISDADGPKNTHTMSQIYYGNIFYSCGNGIVNAQGVNSGTLSQYSFDNAFGAITTAQSTNISINKNPKTLTASPFIDTTDFRLNNAVGGGALLKGLLGVPDAKDLESSLRVNFGTHGGMIPAPLAEVARAL